MRVLCRAAELTPAANAGGKSNDQRKPSRVPHPDLFPPYDLCNKAVPVTVRKKCEGWRQSHLALPQSRQGGISDVWRRDPYVRNCRIYRPA
jgi:hypothetical protein